MAVEAEAKFSRRLIWHYVVVLTIGKKLIRIWKKPSIQFHINSTHSEYRKSEEYLIEIGSNIKTVM